MHSNPANEALKQRISELENEIAKRSGEEDEVKKIFNLSTDMICSGKLNGYFTKINSAFSRILGYSEDEMLGNPFVAFVHEEDLERTSDMLSRSTVADQSVILQNRCRYQISAASPTLSPCLWTSCRKRWVLRLTVSAGVRQKNGWVSMVLMKYQKKRQIRS